MRQHVPVCLVALALLAGCVGENPAVPEVPPDTRMPVAVDYRAHLILHPPPVRPQGRVDPVDTRPDSTQVYGPESRLEPGSSSSGLREALAALRTREPEGGAAFLGLSRHRRPQRAAAAELGDDVSAEDVKLDPDAVKSSDGGYQLNFDNADIKDVLHAVLGNTLGISYSVAPNINGRITISSSAPQNRAELLSTLESALAMQGLSMIPTGSGYRIAPAAVGGGAVDTTGKQPGFGISVVPLEYTSAASVMKLLNGFVSDNDGVRIDTARNAVVIRGPAPRRAEIVRAVTNFDADWMHSQSVSVVQLRRSQPGEIVDELNNVFDADANGGSAAGVIQFKPIKRMRAVMVITRNEQLLKRADSWIRRLDHEDTSATPGVYIYRPRYREARELVRLVNGLFGTGNGNSGGPSGGVSFQNEGGFAGADEPRLDTTPQNRVVGQSTSAFAGNLTSGGFGGGGGPNAGGFANSAGGGGISFGGGGGNSAGARGAAPGGPAGNLAEPIEAGRDTGNGPKAKLSITADTGNNTIVAYTDGETYRQVNAVLRQLDVAPLQVAINVTVAEVALNDALRYGVQFYLNNQPGQVGVVESANTILSEVSSIRSLAQPGGFGFLGGLGGLGGGNSISQDVILSALDSVSKVHILSNPSLVVMENKPATFEVGNQVPVTTQQATSTIAAAAPTLNQVQYLDTGVILKIIPRVGQKGEVDMDLDQIISAVVPDPSGSPTLTPTISKRRVASNISVASGQSVMLAGLIQDQRQKARGQLPFAGAVGDLFGNTDNQFTRTELVIFIRPTIIRGGRDAQSVAETFRGGLRNMDLHAPAVAKQ